MFQLPEFDDDEPEWWVTKWLPPIAILVLGIAIIIAIEMRR